MPVRLEDVFHANTIQPDKPRTQPDGSGNERRRDAVTDSLCCQLLTAQCRHGAGCRAVPLSSLDGVCLLDALSRRWTIREGQ